jgi:hypothetical protein
VLKIPPGPPPPRYIINRQVIDNEEESKIKNAFLAFLKKDKRGTFRSPSTIRKLLNDPKKPMSYAFILNRVNKLIRSWAEKVLPKPILAEKYYDDAKVGAAEAAAAAAAAMTSEANNKSESDHVRALGRLQRARARLDDRVEDPLPEVLAAATRAKRKRTKQKYQSEDDEDKDDEDDSDSSSKGELIKRNKNQLLSPSKSKRSRNRSPRARGKLLDKKKTAIRLGFTPEEAGESDDENIEDPEEEEEVLSQVKKRTITVKSPGSSAKKMGKSQQKKYEGRRAWTDVEKNAVKEGIQNFGIGKWAVIKEGNALILRNRTSGQIKVSFFLFSFLDQYIIFLIIHTCIYSVEYYIIYLTRWRFSSVTFFNNIIYHMICNIPGLLPNDEKKRRTGWFKGSMARERERKVN